MKRKNWKAEALTAVVVRVTLTEEGGKEHSRRNQGGEAKMRRRHPFGRGGTNHWWPEGWERIHTHPKDILNRFSPVIPPRGPRGGDSIRCGGGIEGGKERSHRREMNK